jgi:hypothetical protein
VSLERLVESVDDLRGPGWLRVHRIYLNVTGLIHRRSGTYLWNAGRRSEKSVSRRARPELIESPEFFAAIETRERAIAGIGRTILDLYLYGR